MKSSKMYLRTPLVIALVPLIIAGVFIAHSLYQTYFAAHKVMIASSPANAKVKLNGKDIGVSPITISLKVGTYTLEATKPGYENLEHAVYISDTKINIVNLQLVPALMVSKAGTTKPISSGSSQVNDVQKLADDLQKLKNLIVADPEEAVTIPILNERVRIQNVEIKALREDLKSVRELGKWCEISHPTRLNGWILDSR